VVKKVFSDLRVTGGLRTKGELNFSEKKKIVQNSCSHLRSLSNVWLLSSVGYPIVLNCDAGRTAPTPFDS